MQKIAVAGDYLIKIV